MNTTIPHMGETFALLTALAWAIAVILFKRSGENVHPVALNLFKMTLAAVLILPTMPLFGETLFRRVPSNDYLLLLVSGIIGIGICDTLFFKSLNMLGAGLSAIVDCLYSPFIIGLSIIWIGESLTVLQVIGVLMIVSAVLTAANRKGAGTLTRRNLWLGIMYGAMAMATQAVSIVMVKPLLNRSPLLWVTEVRLIGGLAVIAILLLLHKRRKAIVSSLAIRSSWTYMLFGSFIGAYLALVLWMAGMKFTQASIAAALNQTSNVFVFIFAAMFLHEPINRQRTVGIALGVAGALLVTFSQI